MKKSSSSNQNIFLGVIAVAMVAASVFIGLKLLGPGDTGTDIPGAQEQEPPVAVKPAEIPETPETEKPKEYVNVVFIGQNENHEEVYKIVKREYAPDIDGSKIKYAINTLVLGPKAGEKAKGIYTEIPSGTEVINVQERPDKVIINLSSNFEYGGGTDSVYKRLYQLIKTARKNTEKPVYLYLDGKQADVIGGDGIMITQPLNENSIGE